MFLVIGSSSSSSSSCVISAITTPKKSNSSRYSSICAVKFLRAVLSFGTLSSSANLSSMTISALSPDCKVTSLHMFYTEETYKDIFNNYDNN